MKKIIALATLCFPLIAFAQKNYPEAIAKFQRYYNNQNADSLYSMYSSRMRVALPVPKTKEMLEGMNTQIGKLKSTSIEKETEANITYRAVFEKTELNILFTLNTSNELSGFYFLPVEPAANNENVGLKDSSNYNIKLKSGATVFGTLVLPQNTNTKPNVVLFIAGSGPTDRNCNSEGIGTNAFKMLADSLCKVGIASVRFDKRGVGESKAGIDAEANLRFDDYVNDVVVYIKKLKADGRFNKVFIVGHSEGSLIGMIAANNEKVDGYISLAGAGESADIIMSKQLKTNIPNNKAPEADSVLLQLKKGHQVVITNKYLMSLFRPSVQPYMISWFAHDPQKEIKKLNTPTLILQGNRDLQVSESDAQLLHKAQPNSKLIIIPQMNHVLKNTSDVRTENIATYNNLTLPISAQLSKEIILFCK